jgi:hypothetical protein
MSLSTSQHEWLRRVADYHSGGVSDTEHAAVEAHLATCPECQEALAMYRRFYSLLQSPLRLGPPSVHFDEETTIIDSAPPSNANTQPPKRSPRPRTLGIVAAVVAATLVVVGFLAVYSSRSGYPATAATATPQATTAPTVAATATPGQPAKAPPPQFICANPSGSNLTYVYRRGDGGLYTVSGCANPVRVAVDDFSTPLAWSPSNRYLAIMACDEKNNCPVVLYDPTSRQTHTTKYIAQYPLAYSGQIPDGHILRFFIGWVDDNTFLGALQPVTSSNPNGPPLGTSTIVKVDVASGAETQVGKVAWFAGTKIIAPNELFYAGLKTMSEGQAHLHRLDLSTGADTQLVALGEYGNGGCQTTIFCNWTAPWDVSPNGAQVIYHNPGPTTFPSDTSMVKDTPLIISRLDGSNRSTPFGNNLSDSLSDPVFSPQGNYVFASGVTDKQLQQGDQWFRVLRIGGTVTDVHGVFIAWRGDNRAMVIMSSGNPQPMLYDLTTQKTSTLEPNSDYYLWAH